MADFSSAFVFMLPHEDGRSGAQFGKTDRDNDGGMVRYGLNSNAHPNLIPAGYYTKPAQDALADARIHYQEWYWVPIHGDIITSQPVANKIFDQSVPMGVGEASKLVQRAINSTLTDDDDRLDVDGILGPRSMTALNAADPTKFLNAFAEEAGAFYRTLAMKRPADKAQLPGWLTRLQIPV